MHVTDMRELIERKESLVPELKPYEYTGPFGVGVHSPLVIELFYDPERAALVNERYRFKVKQRDEALAKKDWSTYVFVHERPYRVRALYHAIAKEHDLHRLVRHTWTDSENIWQNKSAWQHIWRLLSESKKVMDANERQVFEWMPDVVTVYRGVRHHSHWPRGLSWTRDKERAVWFAHRLSTKKQVPTVLSAEVSKRDILAYINARGEEEVVVMPRKLRAVTEDRRPQ